MNELNVQSGTDLSAVAANIIMTGDVSGLNKSERITYINELCNATGISPTTKPFDFIKLNGREVVYINKNAAEQLRKIHKISITDVKHNISDGMVFVTITGHDSDERYDSATAGLPLPEKKGEAYCNQVMKCETKAKRRFTLSMCGLGAIDESEIESIKSIESGGASDEIEKSKEILLNAKTNEELRSLWVSLPKNIRSNLSEVKNDMKERLSNVIEVELTEVKNDKS